MPSDHAAPPSLAHAVLPPFTLVAAVAGLSPPDPTTQLYYLFPALVVSTGLTAWLARGGGWERLGFRATSSTLRVFGASWFLLAVVGGIVAQFLSEPSATAVRLLFYAVATVLATWLGYRGGAGTLRRAVAR